MTQDTDTSREAVERLAKHHDLLHPKVETVTLFGKTSEETANVLRAILAERDAWQRAFGHFLENVPLSDVCRASGTVQDAIDYFEAVVTERDTLRAQLAAARDAALEEAAEVAYLWEKARYTDIQPDRAYRNCAHNIRALKSTPAPQRDNACIHITADMAENCPECKGSGMRDSGGVYPWGEYIEVPCDCENIPREVTPQEAARVLLGVMDGEGPFDKILEAADAMNADARKGLGAIPMLGSALRAIAQEGQGDE